MNKTPHFPLLSPKPFKSSTESLISSEGRLKGKSLPTPVDGQISMSSVFSTVLYKREFPLDTCAIMQNSQIGLTFRQLDEMSRRVAKVISGKISLIAPGQKDAPTNADGDSVIGILTSGCMIEEQTLVFILAILRLGATYVNIQPGQMTREGDWKRMIRKVQPLIIIVGDEDQHEMAEIISGANTTASCTVITEKGKQKVKLPHQIWTAVDIWTEAVKLSQEESHDINVNPLKSKIPLGDRTAGIFPGFLPGNEMHWIRVNHRTIHNRIYWEKTEFPVQDYEKFYLTYSFSDPRSLVQLFLPLCIGRPIRLLSSDMFYNPDVLLDQINMYKMSRLHLTPSQLDQLIDYAQMEGRQSELSPVRYWMVSGGHFNMEMGDKFFSTYPTESYKCLLTIFYGCPEVLWAATWCTYSSSKEMHKLSKNDKICMGQPLHNMWICIMDDKNWTDCPIGVKGEICISTVIGRSSSVRAKEDIDKINDMKMYQTGDLGRIIADKNGNRVLFLEGRTNTRVKVKGKTVELFELADKIQKRKIVQRCVAFAAPRTKDKQTIVIAYVPVRDDAEYQAIVKAKVTEVESLIDAVIPIPEIPLLPDDQIDYKSLRREYHRYLTSCVNIDWSKLRCTTQIETETTKALCKAIASSFGVKVEHVTENFHESFWTIGGTPTRAVRTIFAAQLQGFLLTPEDILVSENLEMLLDRMIVAKRRDPIWRRSIIEVKSQIRYEEMSNKHWKDVIRILKTDYASSTSYNKYWKRTVDEIMQNGLSVVAVVSDRVIGIALNCKIFPKLDNVPSGMNQILGLFHKAMDVCKVDMMTKLVGKLAKSFYIAIDDSTLENDAWKVIVMRDLLDQSFKVSQKAGCGSFMICSANPLVQEVATCLLNYQIFLELPMNRYKTKNFEKPFWNKDDHEKVGVYLKTGSLNSLSVTTKNSKPPISEAANENTTSKN